MQRGFSRRALARFRSILRKSNGRKWWFPTKIPAEEEWFTIDLVREGKSSRGGAAPPRVGLMHRAKPVGRALIMHDVSELRPLGFMVLVYARRFT